MALVLADRVEQVTRTTGLADLELAEVTRGRQSFEDVTNNGDTVIYVLEDAEGTAWEIGVGTVVHGTETTLQRTTIRQSSDNDQKISLSAGTHRVFLVVDAQFLNGLVASSEGNIDANREVLLKRATLRGNFVENRHTLWPGIAGTSYPALAGVWTFARTSEATGWSFDVNETVAGQAPRIVTDPATNKVVGLLMEPQRAKYGTYSEKFDDASWTPASLVATATKDAYGFGGPGTGWTITDGSATETQRRAKTITVPDDTATWTTSFYLLKEARGNYPLVGVGLDSPSVSAIQQSVVVNTATGEIKEAPISGTASSGSSAVYDRGLFWQVDCTLANNGTGLTELLPVIMPAYNEDFSTTEDVAATGSVVVAGFNAEVGEYSTSYFKTEATAPLNRTDDYLVRQFGAEFSQRCMTQYGRFYRDRTHYRAAMVLTNFVPTDFVILEYVGGGQLRLTAPGATITSDPITLSGKALTMAMTYDNTSKEVVVYANGQEVIAATLTLDLADVAAIKFTISGDEDLVQIIQDYAYAPELFTPAELGTLTRVGA